MTSKKITSTLMAIIMMIVITISTAAPAQAAYTYESYARVFVNDEEVTSISVTLDSNNEPWVSQFSDLYRIFPAESQNLLWDQSMENIRLREWSDAFGYTMTVRGTYVYLYKQGSGSQPETDTPVNVYVDNSKITGIQAYLRNGEVYLKSAYDLFTVFPTETWNVSANTVNTPVNLRAWANGYGYTMEVSGTNVYLVAPKKDTQMTVYVDNSRVNNIQAYMRDNTVWLRNAGDLFKLFPEETENMVVTSVVAPVNLKDWANTFGYTMSTRNTNVYLVSPKKDTQMTVYVDNSKVNNIQAYMRDNTVWLQNASDLFKVFPQETKNMTVTSVVAPVNLKDWANTFGYTMSTRNTTVYLVSPKKDTQMTVYVNNSKVNNIQAYSRNNTVWLQNANDLFKVFPQETKNMSVTSIVAPVNLKDWANTFGYTMTTSNTNVYLTAPQQDLKMTIRVDNKQVSNIQAYLSNGQVYLKTANDLFRVFPQETKNMVESTIATPVVLKDWVNAFGYTMEIKNSIVYLTKGTSTTPTPDNTVKIYINGVKVDATGTYMDSNGNIRLISPAIAVNLFKNQSKALSLTSVDSTYLKNWADFYGYKYVQDGFRLYLNNNGIAPMKILLNWEIIDFPDQQPFVKDGRTLIPIRAVSETIGWKVEWNDGTVTISSGSNTLVLVINSTTYWVNGQAKTLDVPAQVINGRTMVPVRFIAESFGYTVTYDGSQSLRVVELIK